MKRKIYRPDFSTASDARAVRTRAALRRAMLDLLKTKALDKITIRDIAATAEIGYTTFFRHHPTKEALLHDLAAEEIRRLVDLTVPVMDAKSAGAACTALFAYVQEHRALWSTLLTGGAAGPLREALLRIALEIAAARAQPGAWPPTEIATRLLVGGTIEVLAWWLGQRDPLPIDEAGEILTRTVVTPILTSRQESASAAPRGKGAAKSRRAKGLRHGRSAVVRQQTRRRRRSNLMN